MNKLSSLSRAVSLLFLLAGCGEARSTAGQKAVPTDLSGASVETTLSTDQAIVGEAVTVSCTVRRGGEIVSGISTSFTVSPAVEFTSATELRATVPGLYRVNCSALNGELVDELGAELVFDLGPADALAIQLDAASAQAGVPVFGTCSAVDSQGNPFVAPDAVLDLAPTVDGRLDPQSGEFWVRGTLVGDEAIRCTLGELEAEAILTITPGSPHASQASAPSTAEAGEFVAVACSFVDESGNSRTAPASLSVVDSDGLSPEGISVSTDGFRAERAGTYYAFCNAPGFALGRVTPAQVEVVPGPACEWSVDAVPMDCYLQGRPLPLEVIALDCFANAIDNPLYTIAASPSLGVSRVGNSIVATEEGDYDIEVSYTGPIADGETLSPAQLLLRVDSTGPALTVTAVEPGTTRRVGRGREVDFGGLDDIGIPIEFTVADAVSPLQAVVALGIFRAVPAGTMNTSFWAPMNTRFGLNVITGSATDSCGNTTQVAQSFLRSGDYTAAATSPESAASLQSGVVMQLAQDVLDDGVRGGPIDLRALFEAILGDLDLNALFAPGQDLASDPLRSDCDSLGDFWTDTGYVLERPNSSAQINWDAPTIDSLLAVRGGAELELTIKNLSVPLRFSGRLRTCTAGLAATVPVSVTGAVGASTITGTALLGASVTGSGVSASAISVTIDSDGLFLSLPCGILQTVCDGFTGFVIGLVDNEIDDIVGDLLRDSATGLLVDFIEGVSLDNGFAIPPPLEADLKLASSIDRLVFCGPSRPGLSESRCVVNPPSFVQIGLATQVYPETRGPEIPAGAFGSLFGTSSVPSFDTETFELGIALRDDLLNQIAWALWYGGALDIEDFSDTLTAADVAGLELSLRALSPPVLMPGRGSEQLDIGLGDVYVDAKVDLGQLVGLPPSEPVEVGLYLSTIIGASLDIDPTTNSLQLLVSTDQADSEFWVEVVALEDPSYRAAVAAFFEEVLRVIVPELLASALGAFPLPSIDLASFGVPGAETLELVQPELDRPMSTRTFRAQGSVVIE